MATDTTLKLTADTRATLIHGVTGQEIEDCWLVAGTEYDHLYTSLGSGWGPRHTIRVGGFLYRTYEL